jgi:tetratricopeptide (TPR) repeat protein
MEKIARNAPCPCGSGRKYKRCCLPLHSGSNRQHNSNQSVIPTPQFLSDLDDLSNSVIDLIDEGRLDEAEDVCHELLARYPDQIDGVDRLAMLYEARGDKQKAAQYYRKAAAFARSKPGFDKEAVEWYQSHANRLESEL